MGIDIRHFKFRTYLDEINDTFVENAYWKFSSCDDSHIYKMMLTGLYTKEDVLGAYYDKRTNTINIFINSKYSITSYRGLFEKFSLCGIDFSGLVEVDNVVYLDLNSTFKDCKNLKEVDLSMVFRKHKNKDDIDMSKTFCNCESLRKVRIADKGQRVYVSNLDSTFENCIKLKRLNLCNLRTNNLKYMYAMCSGCIGLEELNLRHFDINHLANDNISFSICEDEDTYGDNTLIKLDNGLNLKININDGADYTLMGMNNSAYETMMSKRTKCINYDNTNVLIPPFHRCNKLKLENIVYNKDRIDCSKLFY